MSDLTVSSITIYPVKGLRGVSVEEAVAEGRGFRGDRRFMVVDPTGRFLTQRECGRMALLQAFWDGDHLVLNNPTQGTLSIRASLDAEPDTRVTVWDSEVDAATVSSAADTWLSAALDRPVRLVAMPETTRRPVNPEYDRGSDIVSFADGYPYLVISDASLADLNSKLAQSVEMRRFRPNFTVSGADSYAEDRWETFEAGAVRFCGIKPCMRCVVTTIDPDTGEREKEPLRTLATYRKRGNLVMFGMNAVPDLGETPSTADRTVRVGDRVRVVERLEGG